MSYESLADEFDYSAEEFHDLCTKHGFMVLPFEPSIADLAVMTKQFPIAGGRADHAEKAYRALAGRRRPVPDQPAIPVKAPVIRQD